MDIKIDADVGARRKRFVFAILLFTVAAFLMWTSGSPIAWAFLLITLPFVGRLLKEAFVVFRYRRSIELVRDTSWSCPSFFTGEDREQLLEQAAEAKRVLRDLENQAAPFPEYRTQIKYMLRTYGVNGTLEILTVARESLSRRERQLVDRATQVGFPPYQVRRMIETDGFDATKAAVEKLEFERSESLLARSIILGNKAEVERELKDGGIERAAEMLNRRAHLIHSS